MDNATYNRVEVITVARLDNPKRSQYAVTLDCAIVLRCGGQSGPDYCEASSFANGLRLGLSLAK